jgi:predicted AlkP superfamily phosphohydrolase/phosphomutase
MAVYLGGPDLVGHRFWQYAYPDQFEHPPSPEQIENFGDVINDYYVYVDRSIDDVLKAATENSAVMILSDHGMHAHNTAMKFELRGKGGPNSGHHKNATPGVFIVSGDVFAHAWDDGDAMSGVGRVLDITPTLLAMKGIPVGEDMHGKPLNHLIAPTRMDALGLSYVDTHDTPAWLAGRDERMRDAADQAERLEQLRSLGYIR